MKQLFTLVIVAILSFTSLPLVNPGQNVYAASSKVMYVTVNMLYVKSSPSSKAKTLTHLSKNDSLLLLNKMGSWSEVMVGKIKGWVLNSQISDIEVKSIIKVVTTNYGETILKDNTKDTSYKKIITPGVKGTNEITIQTIYKNGKIVSQKVSKTVVAKKLVNEVVVVGTYVPVSYNWDKNKTYVYQDNSNNELFYYSYSGMIDGWENWNIHNSDVPDAQPFTFRVKEDSTGLYKSDWDPSNPTEYPSTELSYPIKFGSKWPMYTDQFIQNTGIAPYESSITGVNQTVTTPYGTFTNCIEITDTDSMGDGDIRYYAPNVGYIRIDYRLPGDYSTIQLVQLINNI